MHAERVEIQINQGELEEWVRGRAVEQFGEFVGGFEVKIATDAGMETEISKGLYLEFVNNQPREVAG